MRVLVTGGTGVLGRAVVNDLTGRGHQVVVLTRRSTPAAGGGSELGLPENVRLVTGDLADGDGLPVALEGAETVVHCASDLRHHRTVDVEGTRLLVDAARQAGGPHLLYVSIVGCDRIPFSYYQSKALAELAVTQSQMPWTVLRITQFHDLMLTFASYATRAPIVPVPKGIQDQPISVLDAAPKIGELVDAGAAGRAPDVGGPEVLSLEEILRTVASAAGRDRRFVGVPVVGRVMRGYAAGHHLAPGHATGARTFADFVAEHVRTEGGRTHVDIPYSRRRARPA